MVQHFYHFWTDWLIVYSLSTPMGMRFFIPDNRLHICYTKCFLSLTLSIFNGQTNQKKSITNIITRSKSILDLVEPTYTVSLSLSISHMSMCRNIRRMQSISLTMIHISSRFVRFQLSTIHTYLASISYLIYFFFKFQNSKSPEIFSYNFLFQIFASFNIFLKRNL